MSPDNLSTVAFPSSTNPGDRTSLYSLQSSLSTNSADSQLPPPPPLPYLPFRRISLPSLPPQALHPSSPLRRQSTQPQRSSVASFESFPDRERRESSPMGRNNVTSQIHTSAAPLGTPRKGPRKTTMSMQIGSKPPLLSPMRRRSQNLVTLPLNDPLLVKRRQVLMEFYETEKAYVHGLDLIYEHFLLPILNSLETSTPILERPLLTAVFSNFIDVWNLHHSIYSELTRLFFPPAPVGTELKESRTPPPSAVTPQQEQVSDVQSTFPSNPPPLSPVLLAHFPYLSLYTPFITAFPQTLAALNTLLTPSHYYRQQPRAQTRAAAARAAQNPPSSATASPAKGTEIKYEKRFADFVAAQERHPRCGKLTLRDWLLTIVQRCPRYLLLLGDLLSCTPGEAQMPLEGGKDGVEHMKEKMDKDRRKWHREATKEEEREREKLIQVYGLVSKITISLNTSISSHSQTLALLALQRSTPNLPLDEFQFITPGRTLLKRGPLLQIENPDARIRRGEGRSGDMRPREREFLLFSDCLVWLASEEMEKKEKEWSFDWDLGAIWSSFANGNANSAGATTDSERPKSTALAQPTPSIVEEEVATSGSDDNNPPASAVPQHLKRPLMVRTRSKSEAELTALQAKSALTSALSSNDRNEKTDMPIKSKSALPSDRIAPSPSRRSTHKSNFARINKNSALHLHFQNRGLGRKNSSNLKASPMSAGIGYGASDEEQWSYKGRIELVNLEIVVDTNVGTEEEDSSGDNGNDDDIKWRWEVLSPEGSFVLYAASAQDRNDWTTLIRHAKSQQLVYLNAQHPNSTLTSSAATQHVRRALQALPFAPDDIRMQEGMKSSRASIDCGNGESAEDHHASGKGNGKKQHGKSISKDKKVPKPAWHKERRSRVDHWVPAIWIPDEKAEGCMRCGRAFGWRRRRHHCRLCGRCVCSSCSEKTFYISDPNAKDSTSSSKPARACNACYESVFPLIDPHSDPEDATEDGESTVRARPHPPPLTRSSVSHPTSSSFLSQSTSVMSYASNADTITSLSHLPSWMTMSVPSLAMTSSPSNNAAGVSTKNKNKGKDISGPEALMAIDRKRYSYGAEERRQSSNGNAEIRRLSRDSGVVFDLDSSTDEISVEDVVQPARRGSRIKLRSQSASGSRPRSYHEIVHDFDAADPQERIPTVSSPLEEMTESDENAESTAIYGDESSAFSTSSVTSSRPHTIINLSTSSSSASLSTSPPTSSGAMPLKGKGPLSGIIPSERREDTVRRNKRFSMPAVALQTTSVVARTQSILPSTSSGAVVKERSVAFAPNSFIYGKGEETTKRVAGSNLGGSSSLLPRMSGARSKRFSLVLGGRHSHGPLGLAGDHDKHVSVHSRRLDKHPQEGTDLGKGAAATRLNELLGRSKHVSGE
ncbi:hypothetical protein GYMLUDRAFT_40932 [Collybiopsis luxurians FD-317 M1]|uniref:Unplaced genomic scaffold GYMLUscaffold_15, whole genome shotgun sequence n=1 Tax=Collybiopsis luxurians FD-317 M1 TaxID=944289 RepID=A0A0D0C6Q8_9AGAR|nr:hypothetical protein GYMLUDRAFT_40932 [Collybiopsis luxurians FD-317 M1]